MRLNNNEISTMELLFENCEVCQINGDDIDGIEIRGLMENGDHDEDDAIQYFTCEELILKLKPSANTRQRINRLWVSEEVKIFDRINRYSDIAAIFVPSPKDGGQSWLGIYPPFRGEEVNLYQETTLLPDGSMQIDIRKWEKN